MMTPFETPRLILRELTPDDASFAFDLNNDPEVLRFTGDEPFGTIEEAQDFLTNYADYRRNGYGRWGVVLKSTGALIGWCGLKFHPDSGETDLGFRFYRSCWNEGYASEAGLACLEKAHTDFGLKTVVARAMTANLASRRVLEKLHFTHLHDFTEEGESWELYRITF